MSGLRLSVAAITILAWYATDAAAQDVVPGGWASEFRFQSFGTPGVMSANPFALNAVGFPGANSTFGYGASPFGQGFSPYGMGMVRRPNGNRGNFYGSMPVMPSTVDATDPLIHAIRQSVRPSRRR